MKSITRLLVVFGSAVPVVALAHSESALIASTWAGFAHPFTGADHMLAMLAAGIWASRSDDVRAALAFPAAFCAAMIVGVLLATGGLRLPGFEPMIGASVLVLGALVAAGVRLPIAGSALLVAVFAVFHGHAHALEMPSGRDLFVYCAGFVTATAFLHILGLALGRLLARQRGLIQASGSVISAAGLLLLVT